MNFDLTVSNEDRYKKPLNCLTTRSAYRFDLSGVLEYVAKPKISSRK